MCFWFKKKKKRNWKYVYEEYQDKFLGEKVPRRVERFRIDLYSGRVEEYIDLGDPFLSDWHKIPVEHAKILLSKIEDKGDYFVLVSEDTKGLQPVKRHVIRL